MRILLKLADYLDTSKLGGSEEDEDEEFEDCEDDDDMEEGDEVENATAAQVIDLDATKQ